MLLDHLALAERHVSEGSEHVIKQEERIARMQAAGADASEAEACLRQLEDFQELRVAVRDLLRRQLSRTDGAFASATLRRLRRWWS